MELTYRTTMCSSADPERSSAPAPGKKSKAAINPEVDTEGFLKNPDDWNEKVAKELARREGIKLTDAHWEVLHIIRDFYHQRGLSPIMRIMVKLIEITCGPNKGNVLYLLSLFPGRTAIAANRIAGLPRPNNCI